MEFDLLQIKAFESLRTKHWVDELLHRLCLLYETIEHLQQTNKLKTGFNKKTFVYLLLLGVENSLGLFIFYYKRKKKRKKWNRWKGGGEKKENNFWFMKNVMQCCYCYCHVQYRINDLGLWFPQCIFFCVKMSVHLLIMETPFAHKV